MQTTIEIYNQRRDEIELYFSAIKQLYQATDIIDEEEKMDFHKDEFIKILKSNILLMIYNLVESSVMGGIIEIYEKLKSQNLSYQTVSNEIKNIWFSFTFVKFMIKMHIIIHIGIKQVKLLVPFYKTNLLF